MTLCIAWRGNGHTLLASDSRISRADQYSDYGIKLCPIQVRIFEPMAEGSKPEIAFSKVYGIGFAGSFTALASVNHFLSIALSNLQYVPATQTITFEGICSVVLDFYRIVSKKLQDDINEGDVDFFLVGYCPAEKKIRVAKFFIDFGKEIDAFEPRVEVDIDRDLKQFIEYFGSGEDKFQIFLDAHKNDLPESRPVQALRTMIASKACESVGGNVQFGTFDSNNDFCVSGIMLDEMDDNDCLKIRYFLAGLDMNGDEFNVSDDKYIVMGSYFDFVKHDS